MISTYLNLLITDIELPSMTDVEISGPRVLNLVLSLDLVTMIMQKKPVAVNLSRVITMAVILI